MVRNGTIHGTLKACVGCIFMTLVGQDVQTWVLPRQAVSPDPCWFGAATNASVWQMLFEKFRTNTTQIRLPGVFLQTCIHFQILL